MKQGYTRIAMLLDRSKSMMNIHTATVDAVNTFVKDQREAPGNVKLKLVQFDDQGYEVIFDKDLRDVSEFSTAQFQPRGWTPLWDSQCRIIDELGTELSSLAEHDRPEKVIVVTITDGEENRSRRFTAHDVKRRVQHQQERYNWAFIYLGANQDAVDVGRTMGVYAQSSMSYTANAVGVANTMRATNSYVRRVRSAPAGTRASAVKGFTEDERGAAMADDPFAAMAATEQDDPTNSPVTRGTSNS